MNTAALLESIVTDPDRNAIRLRVQELVEVGYGISEIITIITKLNSEFPDKELVVIDVVGEEMCLLTAKQGQAHFSDDE